MSNLINVLTFIRNYFQLLSIRLFAVRNTVWIQHMIENDNWQRKYYV